MPNFIKINKLLITLLFFPMLLSAQEENQSKAEFPPSLTSDFFKVNREKIRGMMTDRSVSLVFSSTEKVKSNDVNHPFHQDPNFYYLTGFDEPDALLILFKEPYELTDDTVNEIIFVPGRSLEYERWNGIRLGTVGVRDNLGFKKVYLNTEFPDFQLRFDRFDNIYYSTPDGVASDDSQNRGDLYSLLKHFMFKTDTLKHRLDDKKLKNQLASLREIKSDKELELLQKAIDITCEGHKNLMRNIDTSYTEYRAEALIEFTFRDLGAEGPGFPSIVGGGPNTCILHYVSNDGPLKDGDLLVMDIGAQYQHYSADVTRTIPVNGNFTEEQKQIYNLVLDAQKAGIDKCRMGNKFWEPHEAATEVIQRGLKSLGIIKKGYEARKYFMHGTSHYLGLDVHDVGSYEPLKRDNVITVEPGIYIPANSDCDKKWWNIGIRIEDDILITTNGPLNLSDCVPREIEDIEELMRQ